jgi:hypothetical protein
MLWTRILKIKAADFHKTLTTINQITQRHIQEKHSVSGNEVSSSIEGVFLDKLSYC